MTDLEIVVGLATLSATVYGVILSRNPMTIGIFGTPNRHILSTILYSVTSWRQKNNGGSTLVLDRYFSTNKAFEVRHVFLIDRESGIQIEQVTANDVVVLNGDAISAMFSVIQSFVQDAFSRDSSSRLTDLTVGDFSICVAHGSKLMLVCVVEGEMPKQMKSELDLTLRVIESQINGMEAQDGFASATLGKVVSHTMKSLINDF